MKTTHVCVFKTSQQQPFLKNGTLSISSTNWNDAKRIPSVATFIFDVILNSLLLS